MCGREGVGGQAKEKEGLIVSEFVPTSASTHNALYLDADPHELQDRRLRPNKQEAWVTR